MEKTKYYCLEDKIDYEFYRLSKELFKIKEYKEGLSLQAKVLYSFLVDRISLSMSNKLVDEENRVYIFFTRDEAAEMLGTTKKSVIKIFKELVEMDLIEEKRYDRNKAKVIYVKKFEVKKSNLEGCKKVTSRGVKNDFFEVKNLHPIKTDINKTEYNKTYQSKEEEESVLLNSIKNKSNLDKFKENEKEMLEEVIEAVFYSNNFKVSGQVVDSSVIRQKLEKINEIHLENVLKIFKEKTDINNPKGYLMKVLYNNLDSKVIQIHKESIGRDYSNFDFESLYVNKECEGKV